MRRQCNVYPQAATRANPPSTGFTLIEVMIVVVILSVLAAMVVPRIMSRPGEARMVRAGHDIRAIEAALDLYRLDDFRYPTSAQGLAALVNKPTGAPPAPNWNADGYLKKLPKDPWGTPYLYRQPGQHSSIDIYSYGADAQQGGEGEDADIGNWTLD
ncbi:MAG: type II secretion system major pseudopilin GspG [Immundisolibacteraceae bacterium]|nr:type II secretion system major pseudopilin GspG [Immundisolibacteraceae bacterium]